MGEWKKVRLKDVLIEGSKERVDDTSKYQKLTIKLNFKGMEKSKVREKMADRRPFYIREKGEIVIGKQNYFNGSIAILPDELDGGICSNAIMSFKTKKEYNNKYIYYLLSDTSFINRRSYLANGTGQKELSEKVFLNFEVIIPNINEQEKIVHILENVDLIIKNYEKLLKEKNRFIKSQFVEMFGDVFSDKNKFKKMKIKEVARIVSGSTPSTSNISYWNGNINWITPAELDDKTMFYGATERKITEEGIKKASLEIMPIGTVLFTTRAPIGKVGITIEEMSCNQGFKNCICNKELLNNIYLYYLLKLNKEKFEKYGSGSTFQEISKTTFENISIAIPNIELQNKFSRIIQLIDKQKFELERIIENYKKLKKGLIQQLLTGKIKVKI